MAKYKTKSNLQDIWNKLDDACGDIDNAIIALSQMSLPENIVSAIDMVDLLDIVHLKSEVEELIEDN